MRLRLAAVSVLVVSVVVSGCSSSKSSTSSQHVTITVYAASSLTGTFGDIAKAFEKANPGVQVKFNFGASSTLSSSITNGAPADVFASASPKNMATVVTAGDASSPTNFAKNVMEIAVPPGNPAHIASVADLAKPAVKVALCEPTVPCGSVAAQVFKKAGVTVKPVWLEQDVKSTLAKVQLNEVDAGVVYVTDVLAAGTKVVGVKIPSDLNASTQYPIAALTHSAHADAAQKFVAFVTSSAGQAILRAGGFRAAMTRRERSGHTPVVLIPPAVVGVLFLSLPIVGLIARAPWSHLAEIYSHYALRDALRISIVTSLVATLVSVILGVPLAWVLARVRLPGMAVVRSIVTMPLVLPPVVGGVALFLVLGRKGFLGRYLDAWFGIELPFTQHGVVIAEAFVAMPFLVVTMEGAFRLADTGLEEAARTLGASRLRSFATVTLPLVVPSLVAGMVLCWARAIGEFGATLIFGGNVPGATQTMPTLILDAFQSQPGDAVALSLPLMLVAVVVLGALRDRWLRPVASS